MPSLLVGPENLKLSVGNIKLGRCLVLSRAVGVTCSPTCPFHPNSIAPAGIVPDCAKCYALWTEQRFALAWALGRHNARPRTDALRDLLRVAKRRGRAVRLHERGDFGNGKPHSIDARYVGALERAIDTVRGVKLWTYTHVYHRRLSALANRGVSIFASVHTEDDVQHATDAGFDRLALVLPYRPARCKPQVRALPVYDGPRFIRKHGRRWLVCPAQHNKPDKHVTCERCKWCVNGRGNVAFLTH